MFHSSPLLLAALFAFLALEPTHAVDFLTFRDPLGRFLTIAVPNTELIPATVDQTGATQAAIDWARRSYCLDDLDTLAVEFKTHPVRFWGWPF